MNKIQTQQRTRIQERIQEPVFEIDEETNQTFMEGTQEVKFLGLFNMLREVKYSINSENGMVTLNREGLDLFFAIKDVINTEEVLI